MIINTSLEALAAGEQVQVSVGDTLRVSTSFRYTAAEAAIVTIRACPYSYTLGILNRVGGSCGEAEVDLPKTTTSTLKEVTVDMLIVAASEGGVSDGTYGLIAEILGTNVEAHIDDCIVVSGNPAGTLDMISGLMAVMVMMMIIPMMEEM